MPNFQSGSRKVVVPLMMLLAACANQRPGGGAPVTGDMRVTVESLVAADRLKPDQVFHAELANNGPPPGTGTVELFPGYNASGGNGSGATGSRSDGGDIAGSCNSATPLMIIPCSFLAVGALAALGVVLVTTPIWVVPVGLANGELRTPSPDPAREAAGSGKAATGDDPSKRSEETRRREAFVAQVRKAMAEEALAAKLDDAYAATLKQKLESPGLSRNEAVAHMSATDRPNTRVLAGLSRISLERTAQGDESLTVCSRAMVENGEARWRYFETCSSEPVTPTQYGNAEWVDGALILQTQKLALLAAGALRGE